MAPGSGTFNVTWAKTIHDSIIDVMFLHLFHQTKVKEI